MVQEKKFVARMRHMVSSLAFTRQYGGAAFRGPPDGEAKSHLHHTEEEPSSRLSRNSRTLALPWHDVTLTETSTSCSRSNRLNSVSVHAILQIDVGYTCAMQASLHQTFLVQHSPILQSRSIHPPHISLARFVDKGPEKQGFIAMRRCRAAPCSKADTLTD
jgi:hypothetical protein